jgi:hypothetical protein
MADSPGNAGARSGALPEKDELKREEPEAQQEPGRRTNPYGFDRQQWP